MNVCFSFPFCRWEYCKEKLLIGVEAKPVDFQSGICKYIT